MRPEIATEVPALRVLLDEARRVGDARAAAGCIERLSWLAWVLLDGELANECTREAAALKVPDGSAEAFRLALRRAAGALQDGDAASALETLDAAERAGDRLDIDAFVSYLSVRADVLSALGEAEPAIECARLAFSIAQKRSNASAAYSSALYLAYAHEAGGMLQASAEAYDDAARLAERHGYGWQAGLAHARAAYVSLMRGDGAGAHARLIASLRTKERAPWLDVTRAFVGIKTGLMTGDEELVRTFADECWIGQALQSRDAYSIGRTLCAFYDLYRARGEVQRSHELASIALQRCASAACIWPLFAPLAKYGDETQIERARALLDAFPENHGLASAHRRLFEAVTAERRGDACGAANRAGEAYLLFEQLGHRYDASIALFLAGRQTEARARLFGYGLPGSASQLAVRAVRGRPRLSYEAAQTRREVLQLLLQGVPTKEISRRLSLSERTIKSRISEIYARTGTAKRAQLHAGLMTLL